MDDADQIKKVKKYEKEKAESKKAWETLTEPPRGKKEQAEYFNQNIKARMFPMRTITRWLSEMFSR